jgi:cysteine-rich repeat protein
VLIGSVFGATGRGEAGRWKIDGPGTGCTLETLYTSPAPVPFAAFGIGLAMLGTDVLVAESGTNSTHRFTGAGTWRDKVVRPGAAGAYEFGRALATLGSLTIVGAPAAGDGAVYLYDPDAADSLELLQSLPSLTTYGNPRFGTAAAAANGRLFAGAPKAATVVGDQAFVWGRVEIYRVRCGDRVLDAGEQCDDGNTTSGDCCTAGCLEVPDGTACTDTELCSVGATCQDGICGTCTVGNQCSGLCGSGHCTRAGAICECGYTTTSPICGNGIVEAGEECDDGNTVSDDGCSATCTLELPPGCSLVDPATYYAAFGSDPLYQVVVERAVGFGFTMPPDLAIQCQDGPSEPVQFLAPVQNAGGEFAVLHSSSGLPEPFTTTLTRATGTTTAEIVFATGAVSVDWSVSETTPHLQILGGDGIPWTQTVPGVSRMPPLPTCYEIEYANNDGTFACFSNQIVGAVGEGPVATMNCAKKIIACGFLAEDPITFAGCMSASEGISPACSVFAANMIGDFCETPLGKDCRTFDCKRGTCFPEMDLTTTAGYSCMVASPEEALCDPVCEQCTLSDGCVSTCDDCKACVDGQCAEEAQYPPTSPVTAHIRWAKVAEDTNGPTCTCAIPGCSCNANAVVIVSYYGCAEPPATPPYLGNCGAFSGGVESGLPTCEELPGDCDPQWHMQNSYLDFNNCSACSPGGEIQNCELPRPVVLPAAGVIDLRTNSEKLAGCCKARP